MLSASLRLTHSSNFSGYGEIYVDTIKIKHRGHLYSLSDSIVVHTILVGAKKGSHLYAEVSIFKDHRRGKLGTDNRDKGTNLEEDNSNRNGAMCGEKLNRPEGREALNTSGVSLRAANSLGMKGIDNEETGLEELKNALVSPQLAVLGMKGIDNEETGVEALPKSALVSPQPAFMGMKGIENEKTGIEELKNALVSPQLVVVAGTGLISGAQQNNPEEGDKSRELPSGKAIRGTTGAVVRERIPAGIVSDSKSSGKKRKKPAPTRESSRKQDTKEKKHDIGSRVDSPLTEPNEVPNKKGMIQEKTEIGLTTSQGGKTGQVVPNVVAKGTGKGDIAARRPLVTYAPGDEASLNSMEITRKSTPKRVPSKEKTTYAREIYSW
ncbi:hypothetical protein MLD38_037839 [Melastoma candidum]|uniref:Uncharacterized protein n=1 Tax=Melastoma candidum TaxID=119954 RepID=A0ACB9LP75_9MYRT|nr:hypothetical protein MLD38_037839 [Melastoma candidum]